MRHEIVTSNPDVDVRFYLSKDEGSYVSPHWHNSLEIVYVIKGKVVLNLPRGVKVTACDGEFFMANPREIHSVLSEKNEALVLQIPQRFYDKYFNRLKDINSLNGGAAVYYAKNILHNSDMVGTMNFVANLVQIGVMFFTAFIIKKIGKRNMLIIGAVIYGLGFAMFGFVGTNMTGIVIACVLKGVGNAGISSCMFAIVSDTIEYGEWKTGYRTEELINSASSFGFKVGNGLGSAILGWVIGAAGAGTGSEITFIWIPAILCIGQVAVMWFYKLDKEYDGIVEALEKEGASKNA